MRPGGAVINDYAWGRNLQDQLSHELFHFGLNMAWITYPEGTYPRGSYLTHAGINLLISARSDPARTSCDLAHLSRCDNERAQRLASALLSLLHSWGSLSSCRTTSVPIWRPGSQPHRTHAVSRSSRSPQAGSRQTGRRGQPGKLASEIYPLKPASLLHPGSAEPELIPIARAGRFFVWKDAIPPSFESPRTPQGKSRARNTHYREPGPRSSRYPSVLGESCRHASGQ